MIEFKCKCSLQNGNKLHRQNWHLVKAKRREPEDKKSLGIRGVPQIDAAIERDGHYHYTYNLVKEKEGYIFREQYAGSGINGHWPTYREAIWAAAGPRFQVYLP